MKKRRLMIAAFLLAACLVIGFGFAALSTQMEVIGTAETSKDDNLLDEAVYFSAAAANDNDTTSDVDESTVNLAEISSDEDRATFTVNSLKKKGDTATFTFTITSESTYALDLSLSISNTTERVLDGYVFPTSLYSVTTDWSGNTTTMAAMTDTPVTKTLTVTVTLDKNPDNNVVGDFFIRITATTQADPNNTPVAPAG